MVPNICMNKLWSEAPNYQNNVVCQELPNCISAISCFQPNCRYNKYDYWTWDWIYWWCPGLCRWCIRDLLQHKKHTGTAGKKVHDQDIDPNMDRPAGFLWTLSWVTSSSRYHHVVTLWNFSAILDQIYKQTPCRNKSLRKSPTQERSRVGEGTLETSLPNYVFAILELGQVYFIA